MNKKYYGQQCQDDKINEEFRKLHTSLVNQIIGFCKDNNIIIDEFHLSADCLEESIKCGSWQACTDSSFIFDKFTDEYKDVINMKKLVDSKKWNIIKIKQEPFLYSI